MKKTPCIRYTFLMGKQTAGSPVEHRRYYLKPYNHHRAHEQFHQDIWALFPISDRPSYNIEIDWLQPTASLAPTEINRQQFANELVLLERILLNLKG